MFDLYEEDESRGVENPVTQKLVDYGQQIRHEIELKVSVEGEQVEPEVCTLDKNLPLFGPRRPLIISCGGNVETRKPAVPGLVIEAPAPFPYEDNKRVPWRYYCNIAALEPNVGSVEGLTHITRSGRCYIPPAHELQKRAPAASTKKDKEKVVSEKEVQDQVKEPVEGQEAIEFLRFLKHSEYNIVEQLHKQPAKISIVSLLLNSEPHRAALLKVLNQAYVDHNVSVDKLGILVNNISMDNFISFSDDEIPQDGRGSMKALNITADCKGYWLPDVFIDNGSALKVMPLTTLNRLPVDVSHMKQSHTIMKAFDGTKREVVGRISLPLHIGPCTFENEFQVMDIVPNYNCLLGRPWIHSAGAVPSSLHQKMKFVVDGKLVSVSGDEDIVAMITPDTPYIEIDKDHVECPFSSFEVINATFVSEGRKPVKPKLPKATKMGLRLTLGKGAKTGKGLGKYL